MMKKRKKNNPKPEKRGLSSIRWRTALLSWMVTIMTISIFAYFIIPYQKESFQNGLKSKAHVLATSIRDVAAGAVVTEDYSEVVDHCMEVVEENESVLYVVISRNDGFSLIHKSGGWSSGELGGFWRPDSEREITGRMLTSDLLDEEVYHFRGPFDYSGIEWGWINIGLSLESYNQDVATVYKRTALLGLFCIVIGLVASIFYARRVVNPILTLQKTVRKVAGGDLSARAAIRTGDEVESLADSFNTMTEALQATHEELVSAHDYTNNVIQSMNDTLIVLSPEGEIVTVNAATCSLLGYHPKELTGKPVTVVMPHPPMDISPGSSDRNLACDIRNYERAYRAKDGRQIPVLYSSSALRDDQGEIQGVVCVALDMTERKDAESERLRRELQLRTHGQALSKLAVQKALHSGHINEASRAITEVGAETLGAARAGAWLLTANDEKLEAVDIYTPEDGTHGAVETMLAANFGEYFKALKSERTIAADDAATDSRTREIIAGYPAAADVKSILAAPIRLAGRAIGILTLEHTREQRSWTLEEENFVGSLADLASLAFEARDRRQAEESLHVRDTILQAVRIAAERLLRSPHWDQSVNEILQQIGQATGASRIYIFENHEEDGSLKTSQRHEWASPGIQAQIGNPELQSLDYTRDGFARWKDLLSSGEVIAGDVVSFPEPERSLLEAQDILSIIVVPIFADTEWWGFVGLDECRRVREWSTAEIDSIKAAADTIGAGIQREQSQNELVAAKEAAELASKAKSQFLANMSHEIRTPMNGVLGMAELLLGTELNDRQKTYASTVHNSAESLLTVINDILDFSKIEAGRLDLEEIDFDIREVIEAVVTTFAGAAHGKGLELNYRIDPETPTMVRGDSARLRQVLSNLVSNAVKFTESGEVLVRLSLVDQFEGCASLRFDIVDTGMGIEPAVQERIFDAFSQADGSTTRKFGGTGLGLSISKQLVSLMKGSIGVESQMGEGSTFWFTARLGKSRLEVRPEASDEKLFRGVSALIVDDNATNRAILSEQLTSWGMTCTEVESGVRALELLREMKERDQSYGFVVLDMNMPVMNGLETARTAKADGTQGSARVFMLTSMNAPVRPHEQREAGILACLTKPVRQSDLFNCLVELSQGMDFPNYEELSETADEIATTQLQDVEILLAEDNPVNQQVAFEMLKELGCRVTLAAHGREAVSSFRETNIDLVLMDCQMPVMDGYKATQAIRGMEASHGGHNVRIPIVALTANVMEGDRERCLAAGMDDYLPKPFSQNELALVIGRQLSRSPRRIKLERKVEPAELDQNALENIRALDRTGEKNLLKKIVDVYRKTAPALLSDLRDAVAQSDPEAITRTAHSLKSSSANLGATRLSSLCKELETAGRNNSVDGAEDRLAQVESEYQGVDAALEGELAGK